MLNAGGDAVVEACEALGRPFCDRVSLIAELEGVVTYLASRL